VRARRKKWSGIEGEGAKVGEKKRAQGVVHKDGHLKKRGIFKEGKGGKT